MTKEEALEIIERNRYKGHYGEGDFYASDAENLIDAVFDDFESRTCGNCEYHSFYHEDTLSVCCADDLYCNRLGINTPEFFGCNKFKRKN